MREKIIKNRKNILTIIALLLALTLNIGMRYLARPKYEPLPEVRIIDKKEESTKGFAIMIQNESGDGYVEYDGDTWPTEEEGYSFSEAKCMNNNGTLVEGAVTFEDGKITLTTNQTIYCTLYFDEMQKGPLEITNVSVDNSVPLQVTLNIETKGGSGKYTYLVEHSCVASCGARCSNSTETYTENIITISNLESCNVIHNFNIKVTDNKGSTFDYKVSNIKTKEAPCSYSSSCAACVACE